MSRTGVAVLWKRGLVASAVLAAGLWSGAAGAAPAKVYVANEEGDSVTVLDATSLVTLATVPVGRKPHNVQVSPDGRWAWVTVDADVAAAKADATRHPMPGASEREHEAMEEDAGG